MEFAWLQTFITAAKYENFRQTASILYISQPTVTVHIKQLEEELGVRLFERVGKNIKLTSEGKHFEGHAKRILEQYQQSLADLYSFSQGYKRKLTLGISPVIADTILPSVLNRFVRKYDQVELDLRIIKSIEIEELLLAGEVDVGLSCLTVRNRRLVCKKLYDDPVLFVVPHDGFDLETGTPIDEKEILLNHHVLSHCHPDYWEELLPQLKNQYPFVKIIKVSEIHITKRFIQEGFGVSYLPSSTVRRELLEGRLIDVPSSIDLPVAKAFAIYKYENEIVNTFMSFISQYY